MKKILSFILCLCFFFAKPITASGKSITASPYDSSPAKIRKLESLNIGNNNVKVQKGEKSSGIKFTVPKDGTYKFLFSDFKCNTTKDAGACFLFDVFDPGETESHEYMKITTVIPLHITNFEKASAKADIKLNLKKDQMLYICCDPSAQYIENYAMPMGGYLYEAYSFKLKITSAPVEEQDKKTEAGSAKKTSQKITYHSSAIKKGKVTFGSFFSLNAKTSGKGKLTYKSSNTKVLSVNSKGKVTVKGYGPATIQIKASGGNGYKASIRKLKLIAVPARGKVTKAVQENGVVRFNWKAEKTADGYEYAMAYNKKFSGQSKKKTKKTGLALTKYKTGTKKMYLKVRTYKKTGEKTYYGQWSKARLLKLKKVPKGGESSYAITN